MKTAQPKQVPNARVGKDRFKRPEATSDPNESMALPTKHMAASAIVNKTLSVACANPSNLSNCFAWHGKESSHTIVLTKPLYQALQTKKLVDFTPSIRATIRQAPNANTT
uniref:Uncharacterized protein n=1 Tax=Anopheles melas TaxID=34690 RepID=A0A182UDT6_9DIPT